MLAFILSRYDHRSVIAWIALGVLYGGVGLVWSHLIDWSLGMDWLLGGIWAFMTLILAWDIQPRRDLILVAVAFVGGLVIEWWGTTTALWTYYTAERPPLWILPAWPVAALAIDRIARVLATLRVPPIEGIVWVAIPTFVVAMLFFAWPSIHVLSTKAVVLLMLGVLATCRDTRRDVLLFVAGSMLGWFLEYWGTSRHCWNYYTAEVPPIEAVFAHGFASVAFSRGCDLLERAGAILRPAPAV